MGPKIVNKIEKRSQILQAAVETFVNKGFERTTMQDVAERAGIGKGTIYEYFRSKEEIVEASCDFIFEFFRFDESLLSSPELSAVEKFRRIFYLFLQISGPESESMTRLMFHFWGEAFRVPDIENMILQRLKAFYDEFRQVFAMLFRQGVDEGSVKSDTDIEALSSVLIGAIDGIFLQSLLDQDSQLACRLMGSLWKLFCRGALTVEVPFFEESGNEKEEK